MHHKTAAILLVLGAFAAGACKSSTTNNPNGPSNNTGGATVTILAGSNDYYSNPNRPTSGTGFSPNALTVAVGDTVTWTNNDSVDHQPTADGGAFNGTASPGGSYKFTFATAGTFPYHCTVHPEMVGTITVH